MKIKRIISLALALLMLVSIVPVIASCGDSKDGKIVVGLDENFPPMGYKDKDTGKIVGYDIDLATELFKALEMEVEFLTINWDTKETELKSGKVDVLWNGLTITEKRKENMLFTDPYLENIQVIVVKNGSDITTKADLAGKKVGTQAESSAIDAINSFPDVKESLAELNEYNDYVLAFKDLDIGRIDAVVIDEIMAYYYITQNNLDYVLLEDNFGDELYGVGVRLDDTDLHEKINSELKKMKDDGRMAEITERWFGKDKEFVK